MIEPLLSRDFPDLQLLDFCPPGIKFEWYGYNHLSFTIATPSGKPFTSNHIYIRDATEDKVLAKIDQIVKSLEEDPNVENLTQGALWGGAD